MSVFEKSELSLVRSREERTKVTVEKLRFSDYPDECLLSITHNGYQWSSLNLSKTEAIEVIKKLSEWFKLPEVESE